MKNKKSINTNLLLHALERTESYDQFLNENKEFLGLDRFKIALRKMMAKSGRTPLQIIEGGALDRAYGYQLLNGTRKPSRDKLIQLIVGMKLDLNEANYLLKCAEKQPLYAKAKRDSIIIFGLTHQKDIDQINTLLYDNDLQTLS